MLKKYPSYKDESKDEVILKTKGKRSSPLLLGIISSYYDYQGTIFRRLYTLGVNLQQTGNRK